MPSRTRKPSVEKVGGLAFYLSLLSLTILSLSNSCALLAHIPKLTGAEFLNGAAFVAALVVGFVPTAIFLPDRILVFIHETKHALVSGLVGNRWKGMNIEGESGHFEYSYTRKTAHFNALIALAPYYVPLLTLPAFPIAWIAFSTRHILMAGLVGLIHGIDLFCNVRDIDPRQSDFSSIRGGFSIAVFYVAMANLFIVTTLLAWAMAGKSGLSMLASFFWFTIETIVHIAR